MTGGSPASERDGERKAGAGWPGDGLAREGNGRRNRKRKGRREKKRVGPVWLKAKGKRKAFSFSETIQLFQFKFIHKD
jgi:hypothetical protein